MKDDLIYQIALTQVKGVGSILSKQLEKQTGSAKAIFELNAKDRRELIGVSESLAKAFDDKNALVRAEQELAFIEKHHITPLFYRDDEYPQMLKHCSDAPFLLFFKGDKQALKLPSIAVIGTRKASVYGRDICSDIASDIQAQHISVNIVSGLAYGIDIAIHKSCIDNRISTIGVLAHGLDRIYPDQHRQTAIEMLETGGLLTEFLSHTRPDKQNFILRNRIVAGMTAGTIVVESAAKGGALITASMARNYQRKVFAYPGKVGDIQSEGCNTLIRDKHAELITNISQVFETLGWSIQQKKEVQQRLPFDLSEVDESILSLLSESPCHIDTIAQNLSMPIFQLSPLLLDLEFKGMVQVFPGNYYRRRI